MRPEQIDRVYLIAEALHRLAWGRTTSMPS
jgi:hypothetical protein